MDSPLSSSGRSRPTTRQEINVADLRRRLGERRQVEIDMVLADLTVVASRATEAPIVGVVTVESIERGVTVVGSVEFGFTSECRRCLDPVEGRIDVSIMEIFQINAADDSEEISELVADTVDLVPVVRDGVLLGLPLAPLCGNDCSGPDPDRYPTITEEELAAAERPLDPRWAAIDDLDVSGPDTEL